MFIACQYKSETQITYHFKIVLIITENLSGHKLLHCKTGKLHCKAYKMYLQFTEEGRLSLINHSVKRFQEMDLHITDMIPIWS